MCPSRIVLNHVTSRWGVLVLIALQHQTLRFSELRRMIGDVSEKMLSQTLKTLEQDGFVHRKAFDVVPPHVEYRLTEHGQGVAVHVKALATWVEENIMDLPTSGGSDG
ncbi:MAG: helix-turn-helix domain-containing protein [Roseibium sp.]